MLDHVPLTEEEYFHHRQQPSGLSWRVRVGLLVLVLLPIAVFIVAMGLDPYKYGRVWLDETHTQLGMATCSFRELTGYPCPSCGMTSSFALFIRGDLVHSLQANAAGTLLAAMSLLFICWGLMTVAAGRIIWPRSWERGVVWMVAVFVVVMLVRWGIVLALRLGS